MSHDFWNKVHPDGDCWIWTGSKLDGYGIHSVNRRTISAHRFAYEQMVADIPVGLELDHLCRRRDCVNPFHLDPVTHSENMRRSPLMGHGNGLKTHCKRGHEFTPDNTRIQAQSYGRGVARRCRACDRELARIKRKAAKV